MREAQVLGWYSYNGIIYITHEIAEDPMRTASVVNHEMTHQLISCTTPHGFIQEILQLTIKEAWDPADKLMAEPLQPIMFEACRYVHEATATYCGLVDYDGEQLVYELNRLPTFYKEGYDALDRLLSRRNLSPITKYRAARAVGCRAMQTSVLDGWISKQLWEPEHLQEYLADPHNCPDERFVKLVDFLYGMDTEALILWCGRHVRSDTFVLMPIHRQGIADIEFYPLPTLKKSQAIAREIVDILCPGRFEPGNISTDNFELATLDAAQVEGGNGVQDDASLEEQLADATSKLQKLRTIKFFSSLGNPGGFEIAIQPSPFASVSPDINDISWANQVDLVTIDRNVFDRTLLETTPQGKYNVAANHAQLCFFRPGYRAARAYTVPLAELRDFLDRVDPSCKMTVCITSLHSWLPYRETGANEEAHSPKGSSLAAGDGMPSLIDFIGPWVRGRRTLMYTGGTLSGFYSHCVLLESIGTPLLTHRMQAGKTWGVALTRSATTDWPMSVHPILISEWTRVGDVIFKIHPSLERETPSEVFFSEGIDSCLPVLRFLRAYRGLLISEANWRRYSEESAKATIVAAHQPVNDHISKTDFPDAL